MATAHVPISRPARPRLHAWNTFTRWILHTPVLRYLADSEVCELRLHGRRSGRPLVLPVMYAQHGDQLVVLVGAPYTKQWWHNFTLPHPVNVWLRGQQRSGTGHVISPHSAGRDQAARIYHAKYDDIPLQDDPIIVIALDPRS